MKKYIVKRFPQGTAEGSIDWKVIPVAHIDTYKWLDGYTPEAAAQLVYVEEEGFILRMTCAEGDPKAVYRNYNEPVYTDSCMEFFCDWLGDGRYINMEINALGTLLSCIGEGRGNRTPVADLSSGEIFPVKGEVGNETWSVTAEIPTALLCKILGVDAISFGHGYAFRGNFYKCGDETAVPHYGMWNPVDTEKPDFHRPEFFGTLVIE